MKKLLVLGGTGYIAHRLVPELIKKGYYVKVSYRNKSKVSSTWLANPNVELVHADTFNKQSLLEAFKDCYAIYYLVHSMESAYYKHLADFELKSAMNTLDAAIATNVQRIIFLGGLSSSNNKFSKHLISREKVAQLFLESSVATTIFKAGIIIGGGSAPFEITRKLLTYYPVIFLPKSMQNRTQPIAIRNIIYYLVNCVEVSETMRKSFDVGGDAVLSFKQILELMAYYLGIKPFLVPAPFLTSGLSSFGLSQATNVPKPIARSLSIGMISETICQNQTIREILPQKIITKIGGKRGYFKGNWLWQMRGALNMIMGGKGMQKSPQKLSKGEKFDFWTVYRVKPNKELVLWNEMTIPGQATLTYRIQGIRKDYIILHQLVRYYPQGLSGLLNWTLMYGFHQYELPKMP